MYRINSLFSRSYTVFVRYLPESSEYPLAGNTRVATRSFDSYGQIAFNASGDCYGLPLDAKHSYCSIDMIILTAGGEVKAKKFEYSACYSNYLSGLLAGGIAFKGSGLPTDSIFIGGTDYREGEYVAEFNSEGTERSNLARTTLGKLSASPNFLTFSAEGDLIASVGTKVISISTSSGAFSTIASGFTKATGLAFDNRGNLYIADETAGKITMVTPLGKKGVIAQGLTTPNGLVFDKNNNSLYVAETAAGRVSAIDIADITVAPRVEISPASITSTAPANLVFSFEDPDWLNFNTLKIKYNNTDDITSWIFSFVFAGYCPTVIDKNGIKITIPGVSFPRGSSFTLNATVQDINGVTGSAECRISVP